MPILALLLLLFTTLAGAADAVNFRYQVLADLDGNAGTGCRVVGPGGPATGHEWRVIALADRTGVTGITMESCRDGVWQVQARDEQRPAHAPGQGIDGSDRVTFTVPHGWVRDMPVAWQLLAERVERGVVDALDPDARWATLTLTGPTRAVPSLGSAGALLLLLAIGWLGLRSVRRAEGQAHVWPLVALMLIGSCILPPAIATAALDPASSTDAGNDVVDAGADLLGARLVSEPSGIRVEVDVNDIEAAGLPDEARVLFIGNSLTYANDLPSLLAAIAAQAGKHLVADQITLPGAALEDHYLRRTAHAALADGGYQLVILQQGPSSLPESQAHLLEWTSRYAPLIRAGGARPALYMVWPDISRSAWFDEVRNAYSNAALQVGGMFIPAGEAWRAAWRNDPALPLYDADQFHPSPLGSYTAALSMYAELYRQSPVGLSARLTLTSGQVLEFDATDALKVQTAAWSAHRQHGRSGE